MKLRPNPAKRVEAPALLVEAHHYARLMSLAFTGLPDERDHSALKHGVTHLDKHVEDALKLVHEMQADDQALRMRKTISAAPHLPLIWITPATSTSTPNTNLACA
ncbi:MAG: hypothetical protein AB8B94_12205 [Hyphomicrobiales bacterium]